METRKYYEQFGWQKSPFIKTTSSSVPIVERVEEFDQVKNCLDGWDRIIVITAPIGFGKTSFVRQLEQHKSAKYVIPFYNTGETTPKTVQERIINTLPWHMRFGLKNLDRDSFGDKLNNKLRNNQLVLIFDESQEYEDKELFNWLRIFNDQVDNLFVVLVGLPKLNEILQKEASLRDRKSIDITITEFTPEKLFEIVKKRMEWVGGKGIGPFEEDALLELCGNYTGSPRSPRVLIDQGQNLIKKCIDEDILKITKKTVSDKLKKVGLVKSTAPTTKDESSSIFAITDFSDAQQKILKVLLKVESATMKDIASRTKLNYDTVRITTKRLCGDYAEGVVIVNEMPFKGKGARKAYQLTEDARRVLARK